MHNGSLTAIILLVLHHAGSTFSSPLQGFAVYICQSLIDLTTAADSQVDESISVTFRYSNIASSMTTLSLSTLL